MCFVFPDDCCINVHVSSLLDHWLDWEPCSSKLKNYKCCPNRKQCYLTTTTTTATATNNNNSVVSDSDSMSTSESSDLDSSEDEESYSAPYRISYSVEHILSHLGNLVDPLNRLRQFSASMGCDISKQVDSLGKSLLHYIFAGKN